MEIHAQRYFELFTNGNSMLSVLRRKNAYARYIDLKWHVDTALDAGTLGESLTTYGVSRNEDGSYDVDLKRYPQWLPLQSTLASYLSPSGRDAAIQYLKQNGLSEQDAERLRNFLAREPYPLYQGGSSAERQDQLAESFANYRRTKSIQAGRIERTDTLAFLYQRHRLVHELSRAWGEALFAAVSREGQRVLESFALEHRGMLSMAGSDPEDELTALERGFEGGEIVRRIHADRESKMESK